MAGKIKIKYLNVVEKKDGREIKVIYPFFVVPLSDFFNYDPTIEDIAHKFYGLDHHTGKITRANIVESVIECFLTLALNRNARDFLYEKYYPRNLKKNADDDTRIDRFISYALSEPVRFTDEDLGRPVSEFRGQRWSLSVADVKLIILPIKRQSLSFVNDHNKMLMIGRGRARLDNLLSDAFKLHRDFIEHRQKTSRKIIELTHTFQVAQYIKYLTEEDKRKLKYQNLIDPDTLFLETFFDSIATYFDDTPPESELPDAVHNQVIHKFNKIVEKCTLESDGKCRKLVDFLKRPDFQKLMSDREIMTHAEAADNMARLVNGFHLVPSGQKYLRENFGQTVVEGTDTDPVWVRLRDHAVSEAGEDETDYYKYFETIRKTNSAIMAALSFWAYTVKDHAAYEVKINKVFEYLRISSRIKTTTVRCVSSSGNIIGEIAMKNVKFKSLKVTVYDVVIKENPTKAEKISQLLKPLDFFLQVVNCLMVAHQIQQKIEKNEWDAVKAANALASFGSSAINLTGAGKLLGWSKFTCLKAAGSVLGIAGGVTQSALGMYDLYGDMSSMNPYKASGDFLLSAGGMLMAVGFATAWAAGVPTVIFVPIGAVMSAFGVVVKFWFTYNAKEKYIRGTRFYKKWDVLSPDEKYYVVQGGFSHEYPRDEYDDAILDKWFYRLKVELAGDHGTNADPLEFKVKIFNEDRKLLWESEKDEEYLKFNHSIGNLFLPRKIRRTSDDNEDLRVRVALYYEEVLITDFDDFLLGNL
ncbi:MAG: hypothetical protein JXA92_14150 [candidate division Zixibacteria bacterium]|nr:hypothetical protein [candidate division Zixibacteria bacterium]